MKNKLFISIIFILVLLNTNAQSSILIVKEALEKSGSAAIFKQLDGILDSKIAEKKTIFEKESDFNKFNAIMKSGFNSTKAEEYFVDYFVKFANEDSLKNIIKLYDNQLMQEMTKLEEEANSPSKQQEMQDYFAGLKNNPPSQERIQSLIKLNNTVGASEMTVKLLENMIFSMAKGANQAQPKEKQVSQNELEVKLKNVFPESFKQQMLNQMVAVWLFVYKDIDNEKLNKYIQTWESTTGKYFSKSNFDALDYTFSKMGEDVGNSFGVYIK